MLASNIQDPSPEFTDILRHAKLYVGEQKQKLVDGIETALADELTEASARDRRRMQAAADAWLGRRPIYTNHCDGLHYPFLPADEFFEPEHFPWLGELEAATSTLVA